MYAFALRPRWLVAHVLVLALVALMVNLGLWQLRRLDDRREHNAALEQAMRMPAVPLPRLLEEDASAPVEFRVAEQTGRYDGDREVLVRFRSFSGLPGYHVLTPLVAPDGTAVVVNRGWVPVELGETWPGDRGRPPQGELTVRGYVRRSEPSRGVLGRERSGVTTISAVDLARLGSTVPYPLSPVYLQLVEPEPSGDLPALLPRPDLSEGPHLSYAGQWFAFSAIALGGWLLLLRQSAAARARRAGAAGRTSSVSAP